MSPDVDGLVRHYRDQVRRCIEGGRWLVAMDVAVSATRTAEQLIDLGADEFWPLPSRGVGELPPTDVVLH